MNRMMKAEAFRLKRRLPFLIACTVICGLMPLVNSLSVIDQDLGTQIAWSGVIIMAVMMIFPLIFSGISGSTYDQGKLGFYEIMAGNKTSGIVFSKIFTAGILYLVMIVVSSCAYYVFVGFSKGLGSFDHALIRFLLVIVILARVAFCSILITLMIRRPPIGVAACYARFMIIDVTGFPFLAWLSGTVMGLPKLALHFNYMSLTNQLMITVSEPVGSMIVLHVLLGFVIEFALWYFIIDLGIRKRKIA
ncbi:MAG: hypothetical protein K6F51_08050 [Acetatifactor sp.]|nr:hypothetical protein [Acetatifactor sp.]